MTDIFKQAVGDDFSVVDCIKYDYYNGNNNVEQKQILLKIISSFISNEEYQKMKECM